MLVFLFRAFGGRIIVAHAGRISRMPVISPAPWNKALKRQIRRLWQHHIACPCQSNPAPRIMRPKGTAAERQPFQREEHGVWSVVARPAGCCPPGGRRIDGRAQNVADFYKGKTVDLYIGYSVGGAYDLCADARAPHGQAHPRQPDRRTQEHGRRRQPAAGELALQRRPRRKAQRSASSAAAPASIRCSATRPRSSRHQVHLDRSANNEVSICVAWNTAASASSRTC